MSKREPRLLLEDIIEAAQRIKKYTIGLTLTDFISDTKTNDAVIRNFEIIGEAAIDFLLILKNYTRILIGT